MNIKLIVLGIVLLIAAIAAGFIPMPNSWWAEYRGIAPIGMGLWIGAAISLIILGALRLN